MIASQRVDDRPEGWIVNGSSTQMDSWQKRCFDKFDDYISAEEKVLYLHLHRAEPMRVMSVNVVSNILQC